MAEYRMAMDIGGTFLDTIVADDAGAVVTTKVMSTHDDYSRCIAQAVESIGEKLGLTAGEFLQQCRLVINGTTVATNVLAELKGPPIALITTSGVADTLYISRILRWSTLDSAQLKPLPQIVPRQRIRELNERIAANGEVVVPLQEAEVEAVIRELVEDQGAQALAVSLLWSVRNAAHEQLVRDVAARLYPDLPVSLSSEVFPAIREYERTNTTVIDAFIAPGVRKYIDDLTRYFREGGFKGALRIVHAAGGVATPEEIKKAPVTLINSGPAAGYVGAVKFGSQIGRANIITADVGGTSFDAGLIFEGRASVRHRTMVPAPGHSSPGYLTGLSLMDVTAVGTGGGSIAWIDNRGMIRVGPRSAGSNPGPVCFGRGGEEPTLTDACVILGLLSDDAFLGGAFKLDRAAAAAAMRRKIAEPMGFADEQEAAAAVYLLACADMANNVRRVSVEQGHDPRDFSLFSYGGAGGLFLATVCQSASVPEMLSPPNCAVFSAFGALMSDYRRSAVRACAWRVGEDLEPVRTRFAALAETLFEDAASAGLPTAELVLEREADMRLVGQSSEITVSLPATPIGEDYTDAILAAFRETYARKFGAGSVLLNAPAEIVNVRATVVVPGAASGPAPDASHHASTPTASSTRMVFWPPSRRRDRWSIYNRGQLVPGSTMAGPLIVESEDTTIVVPPDAAMVVDSHRNIVVNFQSQT